VSLNDLHRGFRDDQQRSRAAAVVLERLADDREPEECRCLMRFWWQLTTSLSQIGEHELVAGVGDTKLLTVRALIDALRCSPEAVDRWIDTTTEMFPVVHDRGWLLDQTPPSLADGAQEHQVLRRPPRPLPPDLVAVPRLDDEELARAQAACRAGAEGAAMRLGEVLEGRGDLKNAEAAYRLAGEAGNPAAFYALGRLLRARGEPAYRVAAEWQYAADAGLPKALYALAVFEGDSLGRSDRYLRQAARAGHAPACYALGYRAFDRGDYQEAVEWWNQAADHGLQIAAKALENLRADLAGGADRE
jgi:TPR repeat protein